jgi:hypothetical protein
MTRVATLIALALLVAPVVHASDAWVLQGIAAGSNGDCDDITWTGLLLFANTGTSDAVVRSFDSDVTLTVPAGGSLVTPPIQWIRNQSLYTMHLDVPPGVVVQSRLELGGRHRCPPIPPEILLAGIYGRIVIPVRTALQPPNTPALHLGTDLGRNSARNNVAIFNGGSASANVHIETRRGCDGAVLDARDAVVPPGATVQINNLDATSTCQSAPLLLTPWVVSTVVTADQPTASWVSSIVNGRPMSVFYDIE